MRVAQMTTARSAATRAATVAARRGGHAGFVIGCGALRQQRWWSMAPAPCEGN